MKGKGTRRERETIINFNEEEKTAHVWTASEPMYRGLRKKGYCPVEDNERSAVFEVPKKCVSVRKPVATSEKKLIALEKARALGALAKARSERESLKLQGQNGEKGDSLGESWRQ